MKSKAGAKISANDDWCLDLRTDLLLLFPRFEIYLTVKQKRLNNFKLDET